MPPGAVGNALLPDSQAGAATHPCLPSAQPRHYLASMSRTQRERRNRTRPHSRPGDRGSGRRVLCSRTRQPRWSMRCFVTAPIGRVAPDLSTPIKPLSRADNRSGPRAIVRSATAHTVLRTPVSHWRGALGDVERMARLATPGHAQTEGIVEKRCHHFAAPAQPATGSPCREGPSRDRTRPPQGLITAHRRVLGRGGRPGTQRSGAPVGVVADRCQ
jgi:hypothetical protein